MVFNIRNIVFVYVCDQITFHDQLLQENQEIANPSLTCCCIGLLQGFLVRSVK